MTMINRKYKKSKNRKNEARKSNIKQPGLNRQLTGKTHNLKGLIETDEDEKMGWKLTMKGSNRTQGSRLTAKEKS